MSRVICLGALVLADDWCVGGETSRSPWVLDDDACDRNALTSGNSKGELVLDELDEHGG